MKITFDAVKRAATLQARGLDFADAAEVFAGVTGTIEDTRFDYGEDRFTTAGFLNGRFVIVVWTPRGNTRKSPRDFAAAHHFNEAGTCKRATPLATLRRLAIPSGLTRMTRRS